MDSFIQPLASSVGVIVVSSAHSASKPQERRGEIKFLNREAVLLWFRKLRFFKKTGFKQTASVLYINSCLISTSVELWACTVLSKSTERVCILMNFQWSTGSAYHSSSYG